MFEYFCLPPQHCALKSVSMAGVFHLIPASVSQAGEHLTAPVVSINLPSSSERRSRANIHTLFDGGLVVLFLTGI